jgi:group II intron reverse transcriptase/maturase
MMHGGEKSDLIIVAGKPPNAGAEATGEGVERRVGAKENAGQRGTRRMLCRASVSPGLDRVRQTAKEKRKERFTALLHHVDVELLRESYFQLKREAAPGVDGTTWEDYGEGLEAKLQDLHDRVHRGAYRAQPSRRVYIPKPDGRQRPLGIAALEDKIVQRAVVEVLNAVYEEDFLGFSYGFRPGRGQHDALDALAVGISSTRVNWVLDADIQGFFDTVGHEWLMRFVEHRIGDRRILRLIRKWLKAGVMEDGQVTAGEVGTPQGAVISPLLANIYLHYVFDLWAQRWRRREARGNVILVRYADDIVVGFEHEAEAERFGAEMRERLGRFGLTLHPQKTRLIEFGRRAAADRERRGLGKPATFNFLGFTHICGRSRKGKFLLHRRTRRDRLRAKLREVKQTLRRRLHEPVAKTGAWLRQVVGGFNAYHAVPTNLHALADFRKQVRWLWGRGLRQRSQKDRTGRAAITRLAAYWLPKPRILHPWPERRFAVTYPRWEPDARMGLVRFCAGGAQ